MSYGDTRQKGVAVALAAAGLVACGVGAWSWTQKAPAEVRTLDTVLRRLSRGNDLGSQPLAFMVASGSYTAQLARERGLCKLNQCQMFSQLNSYQRYGNGWDELMRQGYTLGDIQGWAASSGTVVIPRATFRAYGPRTGYLACTVAHEIAHIRRHHIFKHSYHVNHNLKGQAEKQKKLAEMKRSREFELEADRDAATMLARAGYEGRVCQQELEFLHRSVGDGSITEPDSTHPGYEERLKAMRAHYDAMEKQLPASQTSTRINTSYSSSDNLLTMTPQPR